MTALKAANLALRFLLELVALGAFAFWGFTLEGSSTIFRIIVGLGAPILAATLWGVFAAPKSSRRLHGALYHAFEIVFFGLAVVALIAAGSAPLGMIVAVLVMINLVLIEVWDQNHDISAAA
jgi:hypothetical protein